MWWLVIGMGIVALARWNQTRTRGNLPPEFVPTLPQSADVGDRLRELENFDVHEAGHTEAYRIIASVGGNFTIHTRYSDILSAKNDFKNRPAPPGGSLYLYGGIGPNAGILDMKVSTQ